MKKEKKNVTQGWTGFFRILLGSLSPLPLHFSISPTPKIPTSLAN